MYLVFEIGGSNMRIGFSKDGKSLSGSKIVVAPQNFEEGIVLIQKIAREFSGREKIIGVAGGVAGPLNRDKSQLSNSTHLPQWTGKPFKQRLEDAFGAQVILDNDCVMATLGEYSFGAGRGQKIMAYIAVGTGVGGARIVDGKLDNNYLGFEPGHQIIVPNGNLCKCGGKGHLEAYIGGSYFEKLYGQKGENITDEKIWDEVAFHFAVGIYNTIVHWSPEIVILGGSVMKSIPLERIRLHLGELMYVYKEVPKIEKAILGDDAGLLGDLSLLNP